MAHSTIKVENLSKRYVLGSYSDPSIINTFAGMLEARRRGIERTSLKDERSFWALKDVSFDVAAGEVVGVIGDNGAGKSTLLKILSRITEPTLGTVRYRGRVGSLLEVGTGFHPELSGRDNIFLNGAILGMREREIAAHLDEIVAFAEVERFIDMPVKRYSSGMYLRLAFAVAAHLETDILLVDEVLAVGDVRFQAKCLARMNEVSQDGRTILFVSHNIAAVQALCQRVVWLSGGTVRDDGPTQQVLSSYMRHAVIEGPLGTSRVWEDAATAPGGSDKLRLRSILARPTEGSSLSAIDVTTPFYLECEYETLGPTQELNLVFSLVDEKGILIFEAGPVKPAAQAPAGHYRERCLIPAPLLNSGNYRVNLNINDAGRQEIDLTHALSFSILDSEVGRNGWFGEWNGVLRPSFEREKVRLGAVTSPSS